MLRQCIWTALFVALQISVALCRSTEHQYKDIKESTSEDIHNTGTFHDTTGHGISQSNKGPEKPDTMSSDTYGNANYYYNRDVVMPLVICSITFACFVVASWIFGCCMIFVCCRKKPKPGIVLRTTTVEQASAVQQPQAPTLQQTQAATLQQTRIVTTQYHPPIDPKKQQQPPPYGYMQQLPHQYQPVHQQPIYPAVQSEPQFSPEHEESQQSSTLIEFHNPASSPTSDEKPASE